MCVVPFSILSTQFCFCDGDDDDDCLLCAILIFALRQRRERESLMTTLQWGLESLSAVMITIH